MSLYALFKGKGPSGFGYGTTAEDVTEGMDLEGTSVLITGCNSGIGAETARVLAARGATVLGAARTAEKAERACSAMPGDAVPVVCELSSPESVRACIASVEAYPEPLDAIICNAGIMALPQLETAHGYEKQFFTNHVGHFMLVTGLLEKLDDRGRVVMVSSEAHKAAPREGIQFDNLDGEKGYSAWRAYGQSKIANLFFAQELARRFEGTQKVANAVHPGVIATNLTRHMNPLIRGAWSMMEPLVLKTEPQGAATQTWAAVHPDAASLSGEYMLDCNVARPKLPDNHSAIARELWERSEAIVAQLS